MQANNAEATEIASMSILELIILVGGLSNAIEGFIGAQNQPRMAEGPGSNMVEREIERLSRMRQLAIHEMERQPSDGSRTSEERIRVIASYDMGECGAGVLETMEKMARLYAQHQAARRCPDMRGGR